MALCSVNLYNMKQYTGCIGLFLLITFLHALPCLSQSKVAKPEFRWLTYGEPGGEEVKNFVANKWGIELYRVAGCVVTRELMDSVAQQNKKVEPRIIKKYGNDWMARFQKDVEAEYLNENIVYELILQADFLKNNFIRLGEGGNAWISQITPIPNSTVYRVAIKGLIPMDRKSEFVTFYKLAVDYKARTITFE